MTTLSIIEHLSAELAAGRSSAMQLTEVALARAQDATGEGARVFIRIDAERARAMARASDLLRAAGMVRSPLEGLPVSVKDVFDIAGQVTIAGSIVLRDRPPAERNAPVIDRLIAAGAVIVGRTNMTEFAFSGLGLNPHYGVPANPWDRAIGRIPGGSSSGAAVSVSDGMAVVGIGSDTGGSIRIPSALCGLTGFKPTQRRVPTEGTLPLSASLDSLGPLAASVRCCAIVDAILAGNASGPAPARSVRDARLGVPETLVLDELDPWVAAAFERACERLRAAGAHLRRIAVPEFAELGRLHARGTLASAEAWAWHRQLLATRGADYDPRVSRRIQGGAQMDAADYINLRIARRHWIAQVEARIADFDALLMPTVPVIAPRIAELENNDEAYFEANTLILRNSTLINFLDGCALSLPCHVENEAPVGLMLAAAGGHDRELLALGEGVERVLQSAS